MYRGTPTWTIRHNPVDLKTLLAAIERIEAAQPGFTVRLALRLTEELRRKNPDTLRDIAPEVAKRAGPPPTQTGQGHRVVMEPT